MDQDALDHVIEGYLLQQAIHSGAVCEHWIWQPTNPTKALFCCLLWFTIDCTKAWGAWHSARHMHGAPNSSNWAPHKRYACTCTCTCQSFASNMPQLLKTNPTKYYNIIDPSHGPKQAAACSMEDWEWHCKMATDLLARAPQPIIECLIPLIFQRSRCPGSPPCVQREQAFRTKLSFHPHHQTPAQQQ